MPPTIHELMDALPQHGTVTWIGVRPTSRKPMNILSGVDAVAGTGLSGDRFRARSTNREVTLIQAEHITALASLLHREPIDPAILRRNIVVQGINLLALKGKTFQIGTVVLEHTGTADPCSAMEAALGPGGYNAMRGHGGITARILESGHIAVGDSIQHQKDA